MVFVFFVVLFFFFFGRMSLMNEFYYLLARPMDANNYQRSTEFECMVNTMMLNLFFLKNNCARVKFRLSEFDCHTNEHNVSEFRFVNNDTLKDDVALVRMINFIQTIY